MKPEILFDAAVVMVSAALLSDAVGAKVVGLYTTTSIVLLDDASQRSAA